MTKETELSPITDLRKKYADRLRALADQIESQPRQTIGLFTQIYSDTREIFLDQLSEPGLHGPDVIATVERIKFRLLLAESKAKPELKFN